MNASIHFELRQSKANAKGECPIFLRVTYNRKPAWLSTGISLLPKYWNEEKEEVRRSHHRHGVLNHELEKLESNTQNAILDLKDQGKLTSKGVINRVKGYDAQNFFTYAQKYIDQLTNEGSVRRVKNTKVLLNKIKAFHGSEDLSLNQIDHEFLNGLKAFLIKNENYQNKPNTIRKNFQRFRHLLETARKENLIAFNPFDDFKLPKYQKPKKDAISLKQIKDIENLDLKSKTLLWHVRNYFLFSFYNAGIRFGDLCKLKRENIVNGRLQYQMSKTINNAEPKWKNIKLLPEAIQILELYDYEEKEPEEYLFPIVDPKKKLDHPLVFDREKQSKNAIVNKQLKTLAKLAGIEQKLSTHIARHSFANYARKSGMSMYSISKALAHSDLKTTESYLASFDEEMLDSEMETLFS